MEPQETPIAPEPAQPAPRPTPPQPTPGPVQQPQPGLGQVAPSALPPKKKMSKGLLWGIIGGSVGLVLLIVGIILAVVLLGGPSKADYKEAAEYMSSANSDLDAVSSVTSSDSYREAINEAIAKRDATNEKLGDMKALRDKDAKKIYDDYMMAYDSLKPVLGSIADLVEFSSEYTKNCSIQISYTDKTGKQVGEEFDTKVKGCTALLDKYANSSNDDLKKFITEAQQYLKDTRTYYVGMADYFSSNDYSASYPKYPTNYPSTSDLYSAITSIEDENGSADDKWKELYDYLVNKANS